MKILFLSNSFLVLHKFRKELIIKLLEDGHDIYISCPMDPKISFFTDLGIKFIQTELKRRNFNIIKEIKLINFYKKIFENIKPNFVFSYTIKPNILGGIASKNFDLKFIPNITGLGNSFFGIFILEILATALYKFAFRNVHHVFFQNKSNYDFFIKKRIISSNFPSTILPGSGVNLYDFPYKKMNLDSTIKFLFASRIMKAKGIDIFLKASKIIKKSYPNVQFMVAGFCEDDYQKLLQEYQNKGIIIYEGFQENILPLYEWCNCLVFPSFYPEGLANVLLEAGSVGRPLICTNLPGCNEAVKNGFNGFVIEPKNVDKLVETMDKFINLSKQEKLLMGENSHRFISKSFSRQLIIDEYVKILK
jgi:galacturonosyltransferase